MGLGMRDYGELTPFVFYEYSMAGFRDKERSEKVELRRLGELLIMPHLSKDSHFDITKYWPIAGDELMKKKVDQVLSSENMAAMIARVQKNKQIARSQKNKQTEVVKEEVKQ